MRVSLSFESMTKKNVSIPAVLELECRACTLENISCVNFRGMFKAAIHVPHRDFTKS